MVNTMIDPCDSDMGLQVIKGKFFGTKAILEERVGYYRRGFSGTLDLRIVLEGC